MELVGEPKIDEVPAEVVVRALFTKETLAEYLRISVYTVQRLVQDGSLTAIKVGSQVRFHIDDVDSPATCAKRAASPASATRPRQARRPSTN